MNVNFKTGLLFSLKSQSWFRFLCWVVLLTFSFSCIGGDKLAYAQSPIIAPQPGVLLSPSPAVSSPILKGIMMDPLDPLKMNFVADAGDQPQLNEEQANLMSRYFLTFLTIPEEDLWVNLSPTEPNRIVNSDFEMTAAGRDMLMEDYILKQFAASITYPETDLGKKFWQQVNVKVREKYGNISVPMNTINKVWVLPDKAVVYEQDAIAFIGESRLKVVLDKDYMSMKKNIFTQLTSTDETNQTTELYVKILREIIIPEIEREVNEGKYFEHLRQMYHAAILAVWFKRHLRAHIINNVYTNRKKIQGIQIEEKQIGQKVYQQYMAALKKGAYNLILEEYDPVSNINVPRKYFSGGFSFKDIGQHIEFRPLAALKQRFGGKFTQLGKNLFNFKISLIPKGVSKRNFLKLGVLLGLLITPFVTGPPGKFSPWSMTPAEIAPYVNPPSSVVVPRTTVAPVVTDRRFSVSTEVALVPDEMSFSSQTDGVVTGLNPNKTVYHAGEVIFRLSSPQLDQRRNELRRSLDIETRRLNDLQPLVERQSASAFEVSTIRTRINALNEQMAQIELEAALLVVRAPENLSIKNFYISNGMNVNRGTKVFDFFNSDRVRITLDVPTTQTYFGRIANFRINGQQVSAVAGVEWQLNPQMTQATATFTVTPGAPIAVPGRALIQAEFLPPERSPTELSSIQGQVRTIAAIPALQEKVIYAPAVGEVRMLVREGDRVRAGQVIAVQQGSALNEYREAWNTLQEIQGQLRQVAPVDGVYQFSRTMIDDLRQREASLLARLERLRQQVRQLQITAPESGVVTRVAHGVASFRDGDELLRIKSSQVVIGNVNNAANAVLIPANFNVQINDPVVVQTPAGEYITARIRNFNRNPVSPSMNLTGVQSIELVAYDTTDALWTNLPIGIIIPTAEEKDRVLAIIRGIETRPLINGSLEQKGGREGTVMPDALVIPSRVNMTTIIVPPHGVLIRQGVPTMLADMSSSVAGNNLLVGDETLAVLKQRAAERIPGGVELNLNGGVILSGGNVRYSGGISGTIQGIMGGVQSGNAIGAAMPIVFNLAGQLMDIISGKQGKMQDLAIMMTQIAQHRMEDAVALQINQASDHFVDVSAGQARIAELNTLLADLRSAREVLQSRQQGGFATATDMENLDRNIRDIQAQIASLQTGLEQSRIRLNYAMNRNLTDAVYPSLTWNGVFPAIPEQAQQAYFSRLDGTGSRNYRIQGALVATQAMERTIELQRISLLPSVSLHSLYISDGNEFNPLYDLVSGSALRTGSLQEGANASLQFSIPIISTERQAHQAIASLEREKVRLNEQRIRAEVRRDLTEAIAQIQELSRQIARENANYRDAYQAWKTKADRTDVFSADQLVTERMQIATVSQRLFDLKAQYFRAESRLRRLQFLGYGESLVRALPSQGAIIQVGVPAEATLQRAQLVIPQEGTLQSPDEIARDIQSLRPVQRRTDSGLSVGYMQFQSPQGGNGLWPLMQGPSSGAAGGRMDTVRSILVNDPNIVTRTRTLDMFLGQFQSNPMFLSTVGEIILSSPYSDVTERLFQSVAGRDQGDFRFILGVTRQAIDQNKPQLAQMGFQILSDALIQNPQRINQLMELRNTFGPTADRLSMTPDEAERVLLTFLNWAPEDSIAKIRLLRSDFWTPDQLARVHARLATANQPSSQYLRQLIYDEILRREALNNIDEIFNMGPYEKFPTAFFSRRDVYAVYMLEQLRTVNRTFLTTSPQWRTMNRHIPERLYNRAKQATDAIIAAQAGSTNTTALNLFDVPNASAGSMLNYFESQDLEAQRRIISASNNFPELSRIIQSSSPLRADAVDRLMTTPQGRSLVLHTYLNSNDDVVLTLIEGRNWMDHLRADVSTYADPVSMDIFRRSMEKMYVRTGQEWPLNVRLNSFSFDELNLATDPRGPAFTRGQITTRATEMALGLVEQNGRSQLRLFAGQAVYSPSQLALIEEVRQRLRLAHDPREIGSFVDQLSARNDASVRPVVKDLVEWRNELTQAIVTNDQSFFAIPFLTRAILWIVAIFGVYFGASAFLGRSNINKASSEELIADLRKELSAGGKDSQGFDHTAKEKKFLGVFNRSASAPQKLGIVAVPESGLDDESKPILTRWRDIAQQWNDSAEPLDHQEVIYGFNNILNGAAYILQSTVYRPELMGRGSGNGIVLNQQYQRTLGYFNLLAIDTLNSLNAYLAQRPVKDEKEREILLRDIGMMTEMMRYVTTYLRVLEYRGIIDKVMSYKFPDDHWTERSKIYPFFRWALLYRYQLKSSQKNLSQFIPSLLRQGESLMPGLYGSEQQHAMIAKRSLEILTEQIKSASNLVSSFGSQAGNKHKMRSFLSRLRLLLVPVTMGFFVILSFLGVTSLSVGISVVGVVGMFVGLMVFWVPHINIMQMTWANIMDHMADRLGGGLRRQLGDHGEKPKLNQQADREQRMVQLAVQEGKESLRKELDQKNESSVDMVVIVSEDPNLIGDLKDYVRDRRGKIFRGNVPVEIRSTKSKGSANVYLEAMQFARAKIVDPEFIKAHPQLSGVSWSDLRVMFVFHGNGYPQDHRILDWAVINGYRVAEAMADSQKHKQPNGVVNRRGNHVVVYSKDAYFGPMLKFPGTDIGLLGDWVVQEDLKSFGLFVMDFIRDGISVKEILAKLDIDKLRAGSRDKTYRNRMLAFLEQHYDLNATGLRQYPVLTGLMGFSSRTVGILSEVLDGMEKNPELWQRLQYLHLPIDLLNNLLKPIDGLDEYLDSRINFLDIKEQYRIEDREDARKLFRPFYQMFVRARRNMGGGLTVNSVLPHAGAADVYYIKDENDARKVTELLSQGGLDDIFTQTSVLQDDNDGGPSDSNPQVHDRNAGAEVTAGVSASSALDEELTQEIEGIRQDLAKRLKPSDEAANDRATAEAIVQVIGSIKRLSDRDRKKAVEAAVPLIAEARGAPEWKGHADYFKTQIEEFIANEEGGVDFTEIVDSVNFRRPPLLMPQNSGTVISTPGELYGLFEGFDFKVTSLRPLGNPSQFLSSHLIIQSLN